MDPAAGLEVVGALLRTDTPRSRAKAQLVAQRHAPRLGHDALVLRFEAAARREGGNSEGLLRFLGSQMAARHADADEASVCAITLRYLSVAREMDLADEVERLT